MPPRDVPPRAAEAFDFQDVPQRLRRVLPDAAARLASLFHKRRVHSGEAVLIEGLETREIGYVVTGSLVMVKQLDDGRRHIVGLLLRGGHVWPALRWAIRLPDRGAQVIQGEPLRDRERLIWPLDLRPA